MSKKFEYQDSKRISHSIEITPEDLTLVQEHEVITDQKMQSKPTTFFKDAMKRFAKNKSSVVGGCILGVLVLLSIVLPLCLTSNVNDGVYANNYQKSLYPKLFPAGTGWWDGCKDVNDVVVSIDYDKYDETKEIVATGSSSYKTEAIIGGSDGITVTSVTYENGTSESGYGGYVRLYGASSPILASPYLPSSFDLDVDQGLTITIETSTSTALEDTTWEFGHEDSPYGVYFMYSATVDYRTSVYTYPLVTGRTGGETITVNFDDYRASIVEALGETTISNPRIAIQIDTSNVTDGVDSNLLISEIELSATDETLNETVSTYSFNDANAMFLAGTSASNYWNPYRSTSYSTIYHVMIFRGSFRYDTYVDALGDYDESDISHSYLQEWINRGWLRVCTRDESGEIVVENALSLITSSALSGKTRAEVQEIADSLSFEILNERCPIVSEDSVTKTATYVDGYSVTIGARITRWKMLFPDADSCPSYLFGTDAEGKDLLKYVAEGLRTSLILGVITFLVCFTFGLIYGAIAGYYGGWTDILMERVTDILGGVPWIVVMTLAIIKWGSNFFVFALALCFTGWIGTSSTTRTQFYRYKNREYILAARTLGASDGRLIFRHILPNAVGTIVTSSVLMIPSVIYSEATLAYLNLGLQGLSSFGVILSDNQAYIQTDSYMILFPAVVMALLMISFNLFGNGLRDAFNPSLKGAEQ